MAMACARAHETGQELNFKRGGAERGSDQS